MADVLAARNELRLQNGMEIVREYQESGQTNKEFCAQGGISEKTYYYWLRKIHSTAVGAMEPQLVRLDNHAGRTSGDMIQIRYGKAELKLPEDVDLKAVMVLLNALRCHAKHYSVALLTYVSIEHYVFGGCCRTAPFGLFAMTDSLLCATRVKSLSRHKVFKYRIAAGTASLPSNAVSTAVGDCNMHALYVSIVNNAILRI